MADQPQGRSRVSTINDVAAKAGVSVATVSRALRGLDRVSAATRERVIRVAEELEYVASPTATSLASGRTRVVGVIAPFLTRWFFVTLVSAIEKTLRQHGHHVLLLDLEADTFDERLTLTPDLLWKRVDGLIALNLPIHPEELELIDRLDLPLVAIGTPIPGRRCVRIDDAGAMHTATEHLISLGHTEIGYVGAVPSNAAHVQTPQERLRAFHQSMALAGLPVRRDWVLGSDWTAEAAASDAERLLRSAHRPSAVVAASDEIAIGVQAAARRLGLRLPEDLSIVGIDDYVLSEVLGITTVRQDVSAQGARAAQILLSTLGIGASEDEREGEVLMPTQLVIRESCAAPS